MSKTALRNWFLKNVLGRCSTCYGVSLKGYDNPLTEFELSTIPLSGYVRCPECTLPFKRSTNATAVTEIMRPIKIVQASSTGVFNSVAGHLPLTSSSSDDLFSPKALPSPVADTLPMVLTCDDRGCNVEEDTHKVWCPEWKSDRD